MSRVRVGSDDERIDVGGLSSIVIGDPAAELAVVVLHGRDSDAAALAPFATSLGVEAYFVFPDAPLLADFRGRTWWPVASEARMRRLVGGAMELSAMDPDGRATARGLLAGVCDALARPGRKLAVVGFAQGGMLAMDYVLRAPTRPAALALLSSSRIAIDDWQPRAHRLLDLPVLVAHGHADPELAFAAGELLRDFARAGGAKVTWVPFDGGHEIPLVVWRALTALLRGL